MNATIVQSTDSRKRVRNLTIKGMIKPSGMRCAKVTNEQGKTYTTQVRPDGTGICTCDSRKPCYHMKALLAATLPTYEELAAFSLDEVMADANKKMSSSAPQAKKTTGWNKTEAGRLYASRERGRLAILDAAAMARECMPHASK